MSGQHTQGRLVVMESANEVTDLETSSGMTVADGVAVPDARRLAACWNIAEGMPTKEIEQGTPLIKVRDKMNAQAQQLAAARALLAGILAEAEGWHDECRGTPLDSGIADEVRAFLKGGA